MTDRSRELVPCCWSLVIERALTTWLCAKEGYSEHSGVCRRTELPRRSVKVKKIWEVGRGRTIQRFKAKWSEFEINFHTLIPIMTHAYPCIFTHLPNIFTLTAISAHLPKHFHPSTTILSCIYPQDFHTLTSVFVIIQASPSVSILCGFMGGAKATFPGRQCIQN